jgi:predicted phosphodiesterase
MDKLHEIISFIKQAHAIDGKPPTIKELRGNGFSKFLIEKHGMKGLLELAGIHDVRFNPSEKVKITNDIFKIDISDHLSTYQQREFKSPVITKKILVIGDVHEPFSNESVKNKIIEFNRKVQPDIIVQVGDLMDMYSYSKFPRSQNIYTPADEERLGREKANAFFQQLHNDNQKATKFNMFGNHDIRMVKRTIETLPQLENIVEAHLERLMTFDNWKLVKDHREPLDIDGILFHHGYLGKLGDHRDSALQNFVVGHTHRGGISYRRIRNETLWELNAGFCGDPESKVMSYTPSKVQNYTLGFGYIDEYGPRFIHA